MANQLTVNNSIEINAPASKVWDALTNPEKTKIYMFGCEALSNWEIGSELLWQANYEGQDLVFVKGHILNIEPNKKLIYSTFDPNSTIADIPENYLNVTYELADNNGKTILNVSQGDYATVADGQRRYCEALNNGEGWNPILVEIKKLVEEN
ncbi:SRPBCC domain-containing protein [Flavobacterium hydatis]|jgi:uncharacterized protein YndB with AHSA1/START domain|uniref:Activator of Hsp90 ATPase homologue 1/2-like C-terminal domain-containing protein n=1 Tax=Flavobacterium hydatis TaxID=991 RepID=A0A086AGE9_FLAHY|nr:SRPBCC domain-containing protein [Flavobacterium hydatis]KFF15763.1 hypothetical protein IW20_12725 [Flavobacterium hydatis]OXA86016.1 hypothetical protein B0A62_23770 [Flavobacterium hydatis]